MQQRQSHQPKELEAEALEREFHVVRKDVNKFGQTPRCPGCAGVTKGISVKHAHNDECRNRMEWMKVHSELRLTLTEHEFEKKPAQEEQF